MIADEVCLSVIYYCMTDSPRVASNNNHLYLCMALQFRLQFTVAITGWLPWSGS